MCIRLCIPLVMVAFYQASKGIRVRCNAQCEGLMTPRVMRPLWNCEFPQYYQHHQHFLPLPKVICWWQEGQSNSLQTAVLSLLLDRIKVFMQLLLQPTPDPESA